jgi:hypothetical protein
VARAGKGTANGREDWVESSTVAVRTVVEPTLVPRGLLR